MTGPDVSTSYSTLSTFSVSTSFTTTLYDSITTFVLELYTLYALLLVEYPRKIPSSLLGSSFLLSSLSAKI
ncbi:hypothetical protein QL285_010273 [Trifolium repens]|nr:hypothetical protein QL285_010273 [Trifolium repens]